MIAYYGVPTKKDRQGHALVVTLDTYFPGFDAWSTYWLHAMPRDYKQGEWGAKYRAFTASSVLQLDEHLWDLAPPRNPWDLLLEMHAAAPELRLVPADSRENVVARSGEEIRRKAEALQPAAR